MDLEPRLLRYFLAVAKELHFGRAAAHLYVSQPALSNSIRKLERMLGADLFVRTSRQVELTPAGRALLEEAPLALAALERAAERARLAGAGIAGTVRLGYAPMAGYDTLPAILTAVEHDSPNVTVVASELYSSEIPGRVLGGELDVGLALFPEPMRGVRSEPLRMEPLALLVGKHHRLAEADPVPLTNLENETLLLFPRELAPRYYDSVLAACERSGFEPRVQAFADPPPQAMVARLQATHEVGLPPASFAVHSAAAEPGVVARKLVQPEILMEWSIVWAERARSEAITGFLESARRCSEEDGWLPVTDVTTQAEVETEALSPSSR
jgi:DNA-binding transcriptional LysR family regulator